MSDIGRIACRHSQPLDGCSHTGDPCDGCPRRPQEAPPAARAPSLAVHDLAPLHEAAAKLREIGDARQALAEELFPTALPAPHYDPCPPRKAPAIDGWVHCAACGTGQPATGHECVTPDAFSWMREARWQQERAEFAESIVCGRAWDHGTKLGRFDARCFPGACVFCTAAQEGGR